MNRDDYCGIEELADWLELSKNTIYNYTCAKKIPYYKIGKILRFKKADICDWIEKQRIEAI